MKDTAKTVEEMARSSAIYHCHFREVDLNGLGACEEAPCPSYVEGYTHGFHAGQKDLLDQCKEGFKEWFYSAWTDYKSGIGNTVGAETNCELAWKAAALATEKRVSFLTAQVDVMNQACNRAREKRQEMLKDLEWALMTVIGNTHSEYFENQARRIRAKWFSNKKSEG